MAVTVGAIYVDVLPSTRDFVKTMVGEILPEADKAGEEIGKRVGKGLGEEAGKAARKGIEDGVDDADTAKKGGKKGKQTGAAFARTFQAEVRSAIESLPEIDLESNPEGVLRDIGQIRKELAELSSKKIGVDLSGQGAIAQARTLREQLASLRDVELDLDVDFDIRAAENALGQLERQIAQRVGGTFDSTLRRSLSSALEGLPELDLQIDADANPAQTALALIRSELTALSEAADINLDIDAAQSIGDVARITAMLQALVDDDTIDLKVRLDAASTIAQLGAVAKAAESVKKEVVEAEREIGNFARSINSSLDSALRNLPEITIGANTDPARAALQDIREELAAFRELEIGVDLDVTDALRGTELVRAQLAALRDDVNIDIDIRANAANVIADLDKILALAKVKGDEIGQAIDDGIDRHLSAFGRKIRDELAKASQSLPDIAINANTDPARAQVQFLRNQLDALSVAIGVDVTAAEAFTELAALQAAAEALDNDDVDIDVRVDLRGIIAQLTALQGAAVVAEQALDAAVGDATQGKISRMRLIFAAVLALFPLIAGAVLSLASLFALLVTPIAAVALGVDGIKTAFAELTPQVNDLREAVADTFERGLAPAVANVAELLPTVQSGLVDTADALSDVAVNVSRVSTESDNLSTISDSFDLINRTVRNASPAVELFAQNIIDLTNVGARGMIGFTEEMRQVGVVWADVTARLTASGAAEAAVRSLLQVLGELLNLVAGLTEFGTVLLAAFGPAIATVISTLAQVFSSLGQAIDTISEPMQTVIGIATTVGLVFLVLGGRITAAATAARLSMVTAMTTLRTTFLTTQASVVTFGASITGLGVASRIAAPLLAGAAVAARGLLAALGGPVGLIITAVITALSFLGQSQADAAASADLHKTAVQELSTALRESGGAIDSHILNLTRQKIEAAGVDEAMGRLNITQSNLIAAVTSGGQSYDALITRLRALADETGVATSRGSFLTAAQREQKEAATQLLGAIEPLRQQFTDAAEENRLLGEALALSGASMVDGVASAAAMEAAYGTLADEMATVEDKAKALFDALIQLSGQTLPLSLAQGALGEASRDLTEAFDKAAESAGGSAKAFLDASGNISTASAAGYELVQATEDLVKSMTDAATSAFDSAGGINNLEVATAAAKREAVFAREAFIKQANEMGITGKAADDLADRYGLIPELVVTLLRAEGIPQVQEDLLQINQLIRNVPLDTQINIGVPAAETISALQAIGIEVVQLPGGEIGITIQDQAARDRLADLMQGIEHPPVTPQVPVGMNPLQANSEFAGLLEGINTPDVTPQLPVGLNDTAVPGQVQGVQGQVTGAPAAMPTELDTTKVAPQLETIRQTALGTVAALPVDPIKGSGWDALLAGIQSSVALTVAQMPVDAMRSVNFDAQLAYIRTTVLQGPPAQLPIDVVKAVSFDSNLGIIKQSLALPPYALLHIDVAKSINFDAQLQAIKDSINLVPAVLVITVVAEAVEFNAWLEALYAYVAANPLIFLIIAEATDFVNWINAIYNYVASTPLIFVAIIDTSIFVQQLEILLQPQILPIYAQIMGVGGGLGMASGGIVSGGGNDAASAASQQIGGTGNPRSVGDLPSSRSGGLFNPGADLNPGLVDDLRNAKGNFVSTKAMSATVARIVKPNTWRVIGDRMHGDEAFIPINNAARSHSILSVTANRMGYNLSPQATGSFMTQQSSSFNGSATWATEDQGSGGPLWRQGDGPLIGQVVAQPGASATDLADEVMFRLRTSRYGGLHSGRR